MAKQPAATPTSPATGLGTDDSFRLLVESVKDYAIIMLDPEGRVASWNPGAERIKGYPAEEIIGQHFSRFYPEEKIRDGSPERELREAAEKGRTEKSCRPFSNPGERADYNSPVRSTPQT